jgi:probable phosphoglycerate mutase
VTENERRLLFLIRHGRSDFDSSEMIETSRGRQWDPPLGEEGRLQADLLGRRLALMPAPAAVYCSTFRRARETVAPFARATGCDVTYLEELGEAFIGDWEGMAFEEIVRHDAEMLQLFRDQEAMWRRAPGAEPLPQLQQRATSAIEAILTRHPTGNVIVVAHGGIINAYVAPLLGLGDREMFFLPDNTSVNTIQVEGARRSVRFLSDIRHLNEPHFFEPDA